MYFRGQPQIMRQLGIYLPELYESGGMALLAVAPSGWGKTTLCLLSCNYLCPTGHFQFVQPDERTGLIEFKPEYRVHFIDEVHKLSVPEMLYPIIDQGQHVIFMATNDSGVLPEALVNRATPLVFQPYSQADLIEITYKAFGYVIAESELLKIIEAGHANPREIVKLCQRLRMYVKANGVPEDLTPVLRETFGIINGIDITGQRYLDFLAHVGGKASIDTIAAGLHVSRTFLLYQVEPPLLYQGKIQISAKGRVLVR